MINLLTLTDYFRDRLVSILSEYLKDFSHHNISQISLGINTDMTLENLEIRNDLLVMNAIPLVITDSKIGKIKISVPTLYKTNAARIDIENVEIRVALLVEQRNYNDPKKKNSESKSSPHKSSTQTKNYKEKKLLEWERKKQRYFKEFSPPTWVKNIVDNILKNMIISVKNLKVYYESSSLTNLPGYVRLSFIELNVHTTDSNWFPTFHSARNVHFREINLTGFSITLNVDKNVDAEQYFARTTIPDDRPKRSTILIKQQKRSRAKSRIQKFEEVKEIKDEDERLLPDRFKEETEANTCLLFPISVTIQIKSMKNLYEDFNKEPQQFISIDVKDPVTILLNKEQIRFLKALNNHLASLSIVQKNIHLRPLQSPKQNPRAWWKYACRATVEESGRNSLYKNSLAILRMRRYINLYKSKQNLIHVPWLPGLNASEKKIYETLEQQIPLENLIKFREWAFIEIRLEAKRFFSSNRDVQGMKPLLDIWAQVVNNDAALFELDKDGEIESIRLTPMEQNDLYEILSYDKAHVLESYLKGERNDPHDILMQMNINVRSFYVLLTEIYEDSSTELDDKRFKMPSVRDWFAGNANKRGGGTLLIDNTKNSSQGSMNSSSPQNSSSNSGSGSPSVDSHNDFPKSLKGVSQGTNVDIQEESTLKSESFQAHLKDIYRNSMDDFIIEINQSFEKKPANTLLKETKTTRHKWWKQNLLLLVEITGITGSVSKYRNGRLETKEPIETLSVMVTTALNFSKAIEERDSRTLNNLNALKYEELYQAILDCDFKFAAPSAEENYNPFILYLHENGYQNFISFFQQIRRDKRNSGDFFINKMSAYKDFFDRDSPNFINSATEIIEQFNRYTRNDNINLMSKEEIILKALKKVEQYICKNILPSFLFVHGVLVLPSVLQNIETSGIEVENYAPTKKESKTIQSMLSKLKRFPTYIQNVNILKFIKKSQKTTQRETTEANSKCVLSLKFDIPGTESIFKIQRIDMGDKKKKRPSEFAQEFLHVLSQNLEDTKPEGFIRLSIDPITIYLATQSIKPLMPIFQETPSKSHKEVIPEESELDYTPLRVRDFKDLLSCIDYKAPKGLDTSQKKALNIHCSLSSLQLEIYSYRSFNQHERKLTVSLNNIEFDSVQGKKDDESCEVRKKDLSIVNQPYSALTLQIEEFNISEWNFLEHSSNIIPILKTKISICFYDCVYKNHPLYIDKKIHILIPHMNLHIDDGLILFNETLKVILSSSPQEVIEEPRAIYTKSNDDTIEVSTNQRNILINKLNLLKKEHQVGAKVCKHCILYHKKSNLILNIFIGNIYKYYREDEESPFETLIGLNPINLNNEPQGFLITAKHSMTLGTYDKTQAIFYLPFLSITKDMGFFKDNTIIHCTESFSTCDGKKLGVNELGTQESVIFKLKPLTEARKDFLKKLDEDFWKYFLSVEQNIMPSNSFNNSTVVDLPLDSCYSERSRINTMQNQREVIDHQDIESNVYLLSVRKRYLHKDLLKAFDINGASKKFSNLFMLRIKEISVFFNSLPSFVKLASAGYAFQYINKIFGALLNPDQDEELPEPPLSKKKSYTLKTLNKTFRFQKIQVVVEKFKSRIDINPPTNVWKFEAKDMIFENLQILDDSEAKRSESFISDHNEDLFSIKSISFSSTERFLGNLTNLQIRFNSQDEQFEFSIDNLSYQSIKDPSFSLMEILRKDEEKGRKALVVQCCFKDRLLSKINISIAPSKFSLSQVDLSYELSSFALFGSMFSLEKRDLLRILITSVFDKLAFDRAYSSLMQKNLQSNRTKTSLNMHTFGPMLIREDFVMTIMLERTTVSCITNNIVFAVLDVTGVKYELNAKSDYQVEVEKLSLVPYDSYYEDFVTNLDKDIPFKLRVKKENKCPVVYADNCKIVYINRLLIEIIRFKADIEKEIIANAQKITIYQAFQSRKRTKTIQESLRVSRNRPTVIIKLRNSCLIMPRNSNSKDMAVIFFETLQLKILNDVQALKLPLELKQPFTIIKSSMIMDNRPSLVNVQSSITNLQIEATKLDLFYQVDKRYTRLGGGNKILVNVMIPKGRAGSDAWIFQPQFKIDVEDFEIIANAAALEELQLIFLHNSKETSKLFAPGPGMLSKINFEIISKEQVTVLAHITKIPGDIVKRLLRKKEEAKKENKKE